MSGKSRLSGLVDAAIQKAKVDKQIRELAPGVYLDCNPLLELHRNCKCECKCSRTATVGPSETR